MTIVTSYTEKDNKNTLEGAPLSKYRLTHWLVDLLKNFMSDPINLRDDRIARLLRIQDGRGIDDCKGLFIVDVPFNTDTRKACTTPAIMVSAGDTTYPLAPLNTGFGLNEGDINAQMMYERMYARQIKAFVAVVTESCDGTLLLAGIIEDFLVRADLMLDQDGMVQQLTVEGSSAPRRIGTGEAMNAKDIYQVVISLNAIGGIAWASDTQGPVYRGTKAGIVVK